MTNFTPNDTALLDNAQSKYKFTIAPKPAPPHQLEAARAKVRQMELTAKRALIVPPGVTNIKSIRRKRYIRRQ